MFIIIDIDNMIDRIVNYLRPFTNLRFAFCFFIAWMITNGIWYVFAFIPLKIFPNWLVWFSRSYIAFLYVPFTPEKLITIPIAIFLQRLFFKKHKKTRDQLDNMYKQAHDDWAKIKSKFKRKKKTDQENKQHK